MALLVLFFYFLLNIALLPNICLNLFAFEKRITVISLFNIFSSPLTRSQTRTIKEFK